MREWDVVVQGMCSKFDDFFDGKMPVMLDSIKLFVRAESASEAIAETEKYLSAFDDDHIIIEIKQKEPSKA